jgi:DNA-binding NtrC family response regulator
MRWVLVIDDDFSTRDTLSKVLRREGIAVEMACDTYDAIRRLRETRFDAVLSDIVMPGGGFMVVSSLRALQPETPIIVLTGYDTAESRRRASENGVFEYLTKPVTPEKVITVVKRAFHYHDHPRAA